MELNCRMHISPILQIFQQKNTTLDCNIIRITIQVYIVLLASMCTECLLIGCKYIFQSFIIVIMKNVFSCNFTVSERYVSVLSPNICFFTENRSKELGNQGGSFWTVSKLRIPSRKLWHLSRAQTRHVVLKYKVIFKTLQWVSSPREGVFLLPTSPQISVGKSVLKMA